MGICAIVFPGTFTDSRQAAWLELMLIQLAFFLGIGVNKKARNSPRNMATLTGEDYSATSLGSIYLVPVHTYINVSGYNKKKELIDAGDYKKGKHQHPERRQKQDPALRKKQDPALRKKHDPSKRKKSKNQDPFFYCQGEQELQLGF
jgi:hypothetical protein